MTMRTRPKRRGGYSLIEVLAAIGCLSIVFGLGIVTIQALGRIDRQSRAARGAARSAEDLAARFRTDVHRARLMDVAPAGSLVLNGPGDRRVTYQLEDGRLVITRQDRDEPPVVESIRLSKADSPAALEGFEHHGHPFARLVLPVGSAGGVLVIEAAVGLAASEEEAVTP